MPVLKIIFFLACLCMRYISFGQNMQLPVPLNITDAIAKGTRTTDGKPGKFYWQNTALYDLKINFNPQTRELSGVADITYTNKSPDTLKTIWFKLYPNIYSKGAQRLQTFLSADVGDGITIDKINLDNKTVDTSAIEINGTNMQVNIEGLLHNKSVQFSITYHYTLNKTSHMRTGEIEQGADFVAYFFPRIAVYDDIDGWNKNPYLGTQEFYNDFCRFKAAITVPEDFVIWATGDLINCSEVLNPTYCKRIREAEKSNNITNIIDSTDLANKNITANNPYNTWKFEAKNVTDFVFALSDHYLWMSSSLIVDSAAKKRTRVDVAFNPKHKDFFDVIHYAKKTVEAMSFTFPKWPFPYPHETVFDGLDQMEYPMMVNDNPLQDKEQTIELTDHEIFHTMFPFYMGINETKYAWMDEGWATIGEWLISPIIDSSITDLYGIAPYENTAGTELDLPITTLTTQLNGTPLFLNSYPKPALGYLYIKDMLGNNLFIRALHYYIQQWNGKHPMPYDFFNCINTGSGINLNWFWQRWFFDDGYPDLAISKLTHTATNYEVTITLKGTKPVPVYLNIVFADNTTQTIHKSIAFWAQGNDAITISFASLKKIKQLTLGSTYIPDVNKTDNIYNVP